MDTQAYRENMTAMISKIDAKQEEIFHRISRIEFHLDKLNGKVADHEKSIAVTKTWGSVFIVLAPILINVIWRMI